MQRMKVIIVGAGGHGKVVADALLKEGKHELAGFADDKMEIGTEVFGGYSVVCTSDNFEMKKSGNAFICAIGNNSIRKNKFDVLKGEMSPVTVIHPFSSVASDAKIGTGTVVLAGTVINASVVVGENCILNSMSLVDHDSVIGNHSHIGQRSVIGSGNRLENLIHVSQNENIPSVYHG